MRSYVQGCQCATPNKGPHRKRLICEFPATRFLDHKAMAFKAVEIIKAGRMSWEEARKVKDGMEKARGVEAGLVSGLDVD